MTYLFVYGSLQSGCRNPFARLLAREATLLGPARMPGRLYRIHWYPGLRPPQSPTDWVAGELYRLRMPRGTLTVLDGYEGKEYRRVYRTVTLTTGAVYKAWVYLYGFPLPEHRRIVSGRWT